MCKRYERCKPATSLTIHTHNFVGSPLIGSKEVATLHVPHSSSSVTHICTQDETLIVCPRNGGSTKDTKRAEKRPREGGSGRVTPKWSDYRSDVCDDTVLMNSDMRETDEM